MGSIFTQNHRLQNIAIIVMDVKKMKTKCEVYSRTVGYIRPVDQWNDGKRAEFKDRVLINLKKNDR